MSHVAPSVIHRKAAEDAKSRLQKLRSRPPQVCGASSAEALGERGSENEKPSELVFSFRISGVCLE
jgi:hypothetical protein